MSTDIHHNDDQYRKAYQRLEEEPSPDVWNKVMADLDSRDAKYYQRKSIRWKRISLLLLLMLGTITLSGILYELNKNSALTVAGTNKSSGTNVPAQTTLNRQPNNNNVITQNINQTEIYAAAKQPKSDSGTIAPAIQPTVPKQLDEIPEQDHADIRKQHSKQVQDTSITEPSSAMRQRSSSKNTAYWNKLQAPVKMKDNFNGKEEVNTHPQNISLYKRRTISPSVFLKQPSVSSHSNGEEEVYKTSTNTNGKGIFNLSPASALHDFTNNIIIKEMMDTDVVMQVNKIAASMRQQTETADTAVAITKDEKAVKITTRFKPRLQLTGYSSFDVTQYHLDNDEHGSNNGQPPSRREGKHEIEERESPGFSFSAGLMGRLQATKKFSVKTGVSYSSISINIQPQTLYASPDGNQHVAYKFITSSGYGYVKPSAGALLAVGDSTKATNSHHQLQYLSVPMLFGYTAYAGKHITIIASIGAAANMLLSANVKTEINAATTKEPVSITKLNGLQSWYPSLMADAEIQYHVKRNWSITLLPSLKYAIRPITLNNAVKTIPYSFGLGLGIMYQF